MRIFVFKSRYTYKIGQIEIRILNHFPPKMKFELFVWRKCWNFSFLTVAEKKPPGKITDNQVFEKSSAP